MGVAAIVVILCCLVKAFINGAATQSREAVKEEIQRKRINLDLEERLEKDVTIPENFEWMWERIERYKETYPEYCEMAKYAASGRRTKDARTMLMLLMETYGYQDYISAECVARTIAYQEKPEPIPYLKPTTLEQKQINKWRISHNKSLAWTYELYNKYPTIPALEDETAEERIEISKEEERLRERNKADRYSL